MNAAGMLLALTGGMAAFACGSGGVARAPEASGPAATATATATAAGAGAPADAGPSGASLSATEGRPFAGSTADATELISRAVDSRRGAISVCTHAFRKRMKIPHDKVSVSFGIDQEGRLLGVTSKGREDAELRRCVQDAVADAPFPRSHAGFITVTKIYEEMVLR